MYDALVIEYLYFLHVLRLLIIANFDAHVIQCTRIDDTEKFQFFKGKYNLMSDELSDIDWDTLFENKNVEEMWNIFKSKLHNSMENHIPKRRHDRNVWVKIHVEKDNCPEYNSKIW
jgi:hypothetical protein